MASTSASTDYKYEVFLSFRGEDTRNSFTDHLYNALCQAGIRTFRDDDAILEGHELRHEITRSIRKSRGSIIVISKNFARSRWCLEELYLILKQKKKGDHFLLPVFYDVEPSDIRSRRGSFRIRAREGTKWTEDDVNRWKAALEEVGNLKGMIVSGLGIPRCSRLCNWNDSQVEASNYRLRDEQPNSSNSWYEKEMRRQHLLNELCNSFLEEIRNTLMFSLV